MSGWSVRQVRNAAVSKPWTKDFRHLQPVPRYWTRRISWDEPNVKVVKPKDRIKYWNIVPGDQVRIRGDVTGKVLEVSMINKLTNRVHLKGSGQGARILNVHYSRCQLFIGNHELPPKGDETQPKSVPVFATRLSTSEPFFQPIGHRYHWDRFAVHTIPPLPAHTKATPRIQIPWPAPPDLPETTPTLYDTPGEAVSEITYKPFTLPADLAKPVPELDAEKPYIQSLFNPQARPYDASAPVETSLTIELTNPHGRAQKQLRWQIHQARKHVLLAQYMQQELADLKGRTRKEARAEAMWKFNNRLVEDQRAERKRRWSNRGQEARLERKKVRKARKLQKQDERLRNLVLEDAPNQVVPPEHPQP
ncbi:hypothetical protein EWM64_g5797 [Hericium alpestre]|uniref:KOW domain-containing protein n=1 Tax=Hericium alpestre TaxID=135208 RepID=A0A4Y9ZTT3_9AGAM|nr:hypothetical protein EWM64_g5797 [Hericium alpestre]